LNDISQVEFQSYQGQANPHAEDCPFSNDDTDPCPPRQHTPPHFKVIVRHRGVVK
jgi:hypothetical protein